MAAVSPSSGASSTIISLADRRDALEAQQLLCVAPWAVNVQILRHASMFGRDFEYMLRAQHAADYYVYVARQDDAILNRLRNKTQGGSARGGCYAAWFHEYLFTFDPDPCDAVTTLVREAISRDMRPRGLTFSQIQDLPIFKK